MKLASINPISQADVLIQVNELPGIYWTKFSGVKQTYTRPKYSDGLSNQKRTAQSGSSEFADVTLEKPYDPDTDSVTIDYFKNRGDGRPFDISISPVNRNIDPTVNSDYTVRGNKTWQISGCRVLSYDVLSDSDTGSGSNVSMIKIMLSVDSAALKGGSSPSPSSI